MQAPSTADKNHTAFYDGLRELIAEPNPMCLAIVRANVNSATYSQHVAGSKDTQNHADELIELLQGRLSDNLRKYDVLARIEASGFVVVIRTLADVHVLQSRMFGLHSELIKPYQLGPTTAHLPVVVGGAVRVPSERPSDLMKRAEQALNLATSAGGKAPVLL